MFTADVQDYDHDKIIRKLRNMYMYVIQKSTQHYGCAGTAMHGRPMGIKERENLQLSTSAG
jgi:hypothetical protein